MNSLHPHQGCTGKAALAYRVLDAFVRTSSGLGQYGLTWSSEILTAETYKIYITDRNRRHPPLGRRIRGHRKITVWLCIRKGAKIRLNTTDESLIVRN